MMRKTTEVRSKLELDEARVVLPVDEIVDLVIQKRWAPCKCHCLKVRETGF